MMAFAGFAVALLNCFLAGMDYRNNQPPPRSAEYILGCDKLWNGEQHCKMIHVNDQQPLITRPR